MIKIAVYGKGGIGKSTTVSNVAAALSEKGLKVMQIGCDPKADSPILLRHGEPVPTVLDLYNQKKQNMKLEEMIKIGYQNVVCVEAGGPTPGLGCAGRGIITALEKLKELGAYELYQPDVVLYDVLGDVVCGGFSMPMRKGYADKVFIITSGINSSALELSEVESGIYEVQNDVNHESEIGMSMARSYLDPTMKLEIKGGKVYYTIKFSGANYMKDHKISINGENVNLDIINEDNENHTIELGFETDTIEPDMKASMYVDAMGRDVEFGIITKTDTLNLIEKIEEPKEEVVEEEVDSTVEAVTDTNNNNTILYVGIGVVVVLVAAFFIMKAKK